MEAISLLLEASAAHDDGDYLNYAARVGARPIISAEPIPLATEIDAVDAILNLRRDSFDSTAGATRPWQEYMKYSPSAPSAYSDDLKLGGRRRRAMSEPWVTMSSNPLVAVPAGEIAAESPNTIMPFYPVLLQPRFPQPLMDIQSQPHAPGMPHRMPTIEEFASFCNKNGRIGIYTKEEREFLIRRFRDKKKRRIWKKKIRYECRKDLADRRIRVKGRFVKAAAAVVAATAAISEHHKATKRNKKAIVLTMQTSGSLSSDNTSEEASASTEHSIDQTNHPPLSFHLTIKRAAGELSSADADGPVRTRPVKPLQLERFESAEDRLKYLASILGGDMSEAALSHAEEDDEGDDDGDADEEEEDDDDDEEEDEEDASEVRMDVVKPTPKPENQLPPKQEANVEGPRSHLRRRNGGDIDYRRPRRHSIAY